MKSKNVPSRGAWWNPCGQDDLNVDNVRFFVIKSYSEDDVHKSIKYGCWTSTAQAKRQRGT